MEAAINSSFNFSLNPVSGSCTRSVWSQYFFMVLLVVYALLASLFIFVLYVGYTKWKKQAPRNISHSDILTLNVTTMESLNIMGLFLIYWATYQGVWAVKLAGDIMYLIGSYGQTVCHCLICVERYIAVVHPVTYLRLKNKVGDVIRIVIVVFIWVFCIGGASINAPVSFLLYHIITGFLLNVVSLGVVFFCSISVLCVLIRPAPGEGDRKRVDQSKRAAFVTIMAILGVLVLRFMAVVIYNAGLLSKLKLNTVNVCVMGVIISWFKLPSSLVVPLLFLHRAGKLPGCSFKLCFGVQ